MRTKFKNKYIRNELMNTQKTKRQLFKNILLISNPNLYSISVIAKLHGNVNNTIKIEANLLDCSIIKNINEARDKIKYTVTTNVLVVLNNFVSIFMILFAALSGIIKVFATTP